MLTIIAALATLASPAVGTAIERGRSTKCVNNLRQIGVAVQQYTADNDSRFPGIETESPSLPAGVENKSTALEVLGPHGIMQSTLTCPTDAASLRNVEKHGSSYHFSPVLRDEAAASVKIYSRRGIFTVENICWLTVCSGFQSVHPGKPIGVNVLKAGGRVIQR